MDGDIERREFVETLAAGGVAITLSGCQFNVETGGEESPRDTPMQDSNEPVRNGRFTVEIDDVELPGWQRVTIPTSTTEEAEYREDEDTDHQKTLWGQTTYEDLVMERTMNDDVLRKWAESVRAGDADAGRKEVSVTLEPTDVPVEVEWTFLDSWVKVYDPPELDTSEDGEVLTERIVLAYDQMTREWRSV